MSEIEKSGGYFFESLRKKKDLLLPMVLSAVLNFGGKLLMDKSTDLESGIATISRELKEMTRGEQQVKLKEAIKEELRDIEKKDELKKVNLRKFFLDTELAEGISESEYNDANNKIEEMVEKFKGMKEKDFMLKILHEMVQEQGKYEPTMTYLSDLVNDREGNCKASAKLMLVLMQEVFPEQKVKIQEFGDHIRVITEIAGEWYAMEKPTPAKLTLADLENTALHESDAFLKFYLGEGSGRVYQAAGLDNKAKTMPKTNTYFRSKTDKSTLQNYSDTAPIAEQEERRYSYEETHKTKGFIKFIFAGNQKKEKEIKEDKKEEEKQEESIVIDDQFIMDAILNDRVRIRPEGPKLIEVKVINQERLRHLPVKKWSLHGTDITDFTFLDRDIDYDEIAIRYTRGLKLETLKGIKTRYLSLSESDISDFNAKGLEGAEINDLDLEGNMKLTKADFLGKIKGLKSVDIYGTGITDLSALQQLSDFSLNGLITGSQLNLATIRGLSIKRVRFYGTDIDHLEYLQEVRNLDGVSFYQTEGIDLNKLPKRKYQELEFNLVYPKPNWEDMRGITVDNLDLLGMNLQAEDLEKIADLDLGIRKLVLDFSNDLKSCEVLTRLPNLQKLSIRGTSIYDLSPLAERIRSGKLKVIYDHDDYVLNEENWQLEKMPQNIEILK